MRATQRQMIGIFYVTVYNGFDDENGFIKQIYIGGGHYAPFSDEKLSAVMVVLRLPQYLLSSLQSFDVSINHYMDIKQKWSTRILSARITREMHLILALPENKNYFILSCMFDFFHRSVGD